MGFIIESGGGYHGQNKDVADDAVCVGKPIFYHTLQTAAIHTPLSHHRTFLTGL